MILKAYLLTLRSSSIKLLPTQKTKRYLAMARVTVEDCLKNVKNRFELVIIAAKRARQLMHGHEARVEWDNDKPTVVALREIAEGHTDFSTHEHKEEKETPVPSVVMEVNVDIAVLEETDEDSDTGSDTDTGSDNNNPTQSTDKEVGV